MNVCKYKIAIADKIKWCFYGIIYNKTFGVNYIELYNCHKIFFINNKLSPSLNTSRNVDDINQEFTIHYFIYYIIKEIVKVLKRKSKLY